MKIRWSTPKFFHLFSAECNALPLLPVTSPGAVMVSPIGGLGNSPPFLEGDQFMYICEDDDVFGLTVSNPVTTCEDTGMFTQDGNPPICVQGSEHSNKLLFM